MKQPLLLFPILIMLLGAPVVHSQAPAVVATIKPVHSLVAAMMRGVAEPDLLIDSNTSLHHISLKPSQRRQLAQADLVFWIGPQLETFMPGIISTLKDSRRALALSRSPGLELLPIRGTHAQHHEGEHSASDGHIWLSTANARAMVAEISRRLIEIDPDHRAVYQRNHDSLQQRITALHTRLADLLRHSTKPFIGYHDSLQYFEHEFNLTSAAFITGSSDTPVSARHLQQLAQHMRQQSITCVFYDTPTRPRIIRALLAEHSARAVAIDTTGIQLQPGPALWFELMQSLGETMASCLNSG